MNTAILSPLKASLHDKKAVTVHFRGLSVSGVVSQIASDLQTVEILDDRKRTVILISSIDAVTLALN